MERVISRAPVLLVLMLPVVLDGCCVRDRQEWATPGAERGATQQRLRAVEGQSFMVPCPTSPTGHIRTEWVGTGRQPPPAFDCGRVFTAEVNHTGTYRSMTGGSEFLLQLQVLEESGVRCVHEEEEDGDIELQNGAEGQIPCPGFNCSHNNTEVTWYKGNVSVSLLKRETCVESGVLHLCEVMGKYDEGAYFCDRPIRERGVTWTLRRAVKARVVPHEIKSGPRDPPRIEYPADNMTQEVELGQPHTLTCKVFFPYERKRSGEVNWYVNSGGDRESATLLNMKEPPQKTEIMEEYGIIREGVIEEVTRQQLLHTFTCSATNVVGRRSVTITLKRKVKWPTLIGYPIACVLLVIGLGVILHVKWLEIRIIYRSRWSHGKRDEGEKRFDVFLSYVWSPTSAETDGGGPPSARSGPRVTDEDACPSGIELLNPEGCEARQGPLQVRLRRVLEEEWGYRVCLLERDVLPGGAFTNAVVQAIQRSRMLVCLLSADYLRDNNAAFVLESGVQALLRNTSVKLLLIRTCRDSVPQEPPLPPLVHRALKVLPCLMWSTSGGPAGRFWTSLRKRMPDQIHTGFTRVGPED